MPVAASAWALVDLPYVKRRIGGDWTGPNGSLDDEAIQDIINGVSGDFITETSRYLLIRTYTAEAYDGKGQRKLFLKQAPLISVSALQVVYRGSLMTIPQATDATMPGFLIDADYGAIELTRYTIPNQFPNGLGNVLVSYSAGYDPASTNLTYAAEAEEARRQCARQVIHEYQRRATEGKNSEALGAGQTVSFVTADFLPPVRRYLERKRRRTA